MVFKDNSLVAAEGDVDLEAAARGADYREDRAKLIDSQRKGKPVRRL